jgi:hypothetical protein
MYCLIVLLYFHLCKDLSLIEGYWVNFGMNVIYNYPMINPAISFMTLIMKWYKYRPSSDEVIPLPFK